MKLENVNTAANIAKKHAHICKILKEVDTLDIDLRIYNYGTIEFHRIDDCTAILEFVRDMLADDLRALGVEV